MLYFSILFQPHDKLRCSSGLDTGRLLCHSEEGSLHAVHHWNNSVFCCYLHLFNHHPRVKVNLLSTFILNIYHQKNTSDFTPVSRNLQMSKPIIHIINFLIFKFFLHNIP